jgi:GMP synthase-like glutamine amidotransferase
MKPVAIFRFSRTEGPGYFATFLTERGIPWTLFKLDAGERVPDDLSQYGGFAFMGGPMSVNDDLPWIAPILELIRKAVKNDQPCIGHCLGGQLISKALGGVVEPNPQKEIGWCEARIENNAAAQEWLGKLPGFTTFQWHGETFTIPPGATRILTSPHCANQAYVLGKHLGMQCHVEMTPELIETWCNDGADEIAEQMTRGTHDAVQSVQEIRRETPAKLPGLNSVAAQLYTKWIDGINA